MNKVLKITITSLVAATIAAAPCFASIQDCIGGGDSKYPNITIAEDDKTPEGYPVRCQKIKEIDEDGSSRYLNIYAKTSADCAQAGALVTDPYACEEEGVSSADDLDIAPAPTTGTDPITTGTTGNETAKETTAKEEEKPSVLLIVSLVANGVLLLAVIILIVLLSKKSSALSAANATIASTQVVPPHNSQIPYTPEQQ